MPARTNSDFLNSLPSFLARFLRSASSACSWAGIEKLSRTNFTFFGFAIVLVAATGLALATVDTDLATTGFRFLATIVDTGLRAAVGTTRRAGAFAALVAGFATDLVAGRAVLRATVVRTAGLRVVVGRVAKMSSLLITIH